MMKLFCIGLFIFIGLSQLNAQPQSTPTHNSKKPLDHSVYDGWQSVSKIIISNDGKWVVYSINVQEGDNTLVVQSTDNRYKKVIPRGYDAVISGDSKSIFFKIKPLFKDLREARIKKKKPDEIPKDSFAILQAGADSIKKFPGILSFKTPKETNEWVAILLRNEPPVKGKSNYQADKNKDSINRIIDSLHYIINTLKPGPANKDSITDPEKNNHLLLINSKTGQQKIFKNVSDYLFNKKGSHLLMEQTLNLRDSVESARIVLYHLATAKSDTLIRGGNDFKNLTLSDDGKRAVFVALRNTSPKALIKTYNLWHYQQGMDSAKILVDTLTNNLPKGYTISQFGRIGFSNSGERLIFATAPQKQPKDTTLIDIDKVNLDIWNYKDDYLQPYQLENQKREQERNYTAVYDFNLKRMIQIASPDVPNVYQGSLADAKYFVAITDTGRRISSQWTGNTIKDVYMVDEAKGVFKPAIMNLNGNIQSNWVSPYGKYILWYDNTDKNYHSFDGNKTVNITASITVPLYDEENDVPDYPSPYGVMGWQDGEKLVLIYDRYDIWAVDPAGKASPINLTINGRKQKITYRYIATDTDEDYIKSTSKNLLQTFDNVNKNAGLSVLENNKLNTSLLPIQSYNIAQVTKARNADVYAYTKENYIQSPDIYSLQQKKEQKLSATNPQQQIYNWGTAALYNWKTFSGKPATGIIYKPEDFDSTKKYPVILYFYEKLSDELYRYIAPAPTPSRLNISFFVSRGYIVMAPDISYTTGHPAQSAYDYIVSGAQSLTQFNWIDKKHIGIQGQSWGGYQVAQLITMTDIFAAAWAGAPVANMTSAYGGIRWKGGINRQFQYEKTQSRIGATLWEKPELYIENSPLFNLPKVNTPIVIMANDNDGAVPWYQGIELFTGLKRLGKPAWMLNYNGEEHNLVQRKNRKDIQVREQQFFDWLLKGEKPAKWLIEGVPAVDKGNSWGLGIME